VSTPERARPHPDWRVRVVRRTGHRGLALAIFAVTCFMYGGGLVAGYQPTFRQVWGYIPIHYFGWGWIATGLICCTGVLSRADRWQFTVAVAWVAGWVLVFLTNWRGPVGWASTASWLCVALMLLAAAGWPERPSLTELERLQRRLDRAHDELGAVAHEVEQAAAESAGGPP
jgi:hypothetical protein